MKVSLYIAFTAIVIVGTTMLGSRAPLLSVPASKPSYGDHVCWANPTPKALKKCTKPYTCSGVGTYAWHPKKKIATRNAIRFCNKKFGKRACVLDYCELLRRK